MVSAGSLLIHQSIHPSIQRQMTVTLFIPCFVDLVYPRVGISIVEISKKLGHKVEYPEALTCCGQPAFNSGYWPEAREVALPV